MKNAEVSLLYQPNSFTTFRERKRAENKLLKKGQVFTLLNLVISDGGRYSCEAEIQDEKTIRWPKGTGVLILSQAELPAFFKLRPGKPVTVRQGQEVKVNCESEGVTITKLQWKKLTNSGEVPVPDSMVTIVKDRSTNRVRAILKITNAQRKDGGPYKCVLRVFDKTDFRPTRITVKEPLVFLEPPQVVIQGYLGQNVIINCTTNDQDAKVSLLHRRHPFASFTERKPKAYKLWKKRQVFRILNIDVRDAGMYSCAATDRAHQSIHWPRFTGYLILSQASLPDFFVLRPGRPIPVLMGQDTEVKCESEGVTTTKLQWKKETNSGEVIVPDRKVTIVKDRSTNRVRAILKITNAQKKDGGFYKCVVTVDGMTNHKRTRIIVTEPFTFLNEPPVILHGSLGLNLIINCSTNDEGAAVSLLHSLTPSFMPFTERRPKAYKVLKRGQVFTILNLKMNDAGKYSCVATNKANQTIQWPPGAGFFVISRASLPEYFVLLPTKPVTMLHGQDAKVTCESVGVTTTKLQWKKQTDSGEGPVPDSMVTIVKDQSTNRVRAILKITNAQKKDSGFYKCVMTVSGKTDYKMTRIILDGKI